MPDHVLPVSRSADFLELLCTFLLCSVMCKVIRVCFGFALVRLLIGLKISRHFLDQLKLKPIVSRTRAFSSRASLRLNVFASSFDWFTRFSVSFVIGQSDGFGFATLNRKNSL